jgi:glycerophosphoryl diester phosphodiesterase
MRQTVSSQTPAGRGLESSYAIDMTGYRTQVIAHRPRDRFGRTNCLPAINSVLPAADIIEVDLRECSDGGLVALHDAQLATVSDVSGAISELSLEEALQIRLNPLRSVSAEDSMATIPTLGQVVTCCANQAGLYLDCRDVSAAALLSNLATVKTSAPIWICSSNVELMIRLQHELPHVRRVTTWRSEMSGIDDLPGWANEIEFFPDTISEQHVAEVRKSGRKIGYLTLGDCDHLEQWQRAIEMHVDWIMTDNPAALRQFLTSKSSNA